MSSIISQVINNLGNYSIYKNEKLIIKFNRLIIVKQPHSKYLATLSLGLNNTYSTSNKYKADFNRLEFALKFFNEHIKYNKMYYSTIEIVSIYINDIHHKSFLINMYK